ncbi:MAG TPA: M48 family metalloprotease [Bacteroidales bacterium]|nr:M48 family metalloprotease [Bacteroidales bacterium]
MFNKLYYPFRIGLIMGFGFAIIQIVIPILFQKMHLQKKRYYIIDWKQIIAKSVFLFLILFFTIFWIQEFRNFGILLFIFTLISLSFLFTYDFILRPILLRFNPHLKKAPDKLTKWATEKFNKKIEIYVYNGILINAFATGLIPVSHTIVLGEPILQNCTLNEQKAVLAHEIGHLVKSHLKIIYGTTVGLSLLLFIFLLLIDKTTQGTLNFLFGLITVVLYILIFMIYFYGLIRKKLEISADCFAAGVVGCELYVQTLHHIDNMMEGKISKGGFTHPRLSQRIEAVQRANNKNE